MLNASLSTEKGKPGNHAELWEPFMKFLFEEVLMTNGSPVVFLGREAAKLKRYVMPFTWIFELQHPAAPAYSSSNWNEEDIFNKINRILEENNGETIQWIKTNS
jgi:uracil DNA glycosylase